MLNVIICSEQKKSLIRAAIKKCFGGKTMTKIGFIVGIIICLACVLIITSVIIKMSHTDGQRAKYDERQQVARGKGYTYAFYTAAITAIIPCFIPEGIKVFLGDILYFMPLLAGILVHVTYCIFNDAYMELNAEPKRWISMFICIGIANFLIAFASCKDGFVEKGSLKTGVINLSMGILFMIIMLEVFIKSRLDAKEAGDDEEFEA